MQEKEIDQDESFRIAQSEIQEEQFATTQEFREAIENRALDIQQNGLDQQTAMALAERTWRTGEADRTRDHDIDMMERANKAHKALMEELFGDKDKDKDKNKDDQQQKQSNNNNTTLEEFDEDNRPPGGPWTWDDIEGWVGEDNQAYMP